MSALPRPDLPPGHQRDLVEALHDLHHRRGWPSLRALAAGAGCSHTTVSKCFSSAALPGWGTLELLVEAMHGDTGHFHELWLAASTPSDGAPAQTRIAGRKAELAAVRRHLETGHGLLLVTGEAGMGKTRLVTTATETTDTFVATGHCLPLSTEVPMLPLADCLRSVYDEDATWVERAIAGCPAYVVQSLVHLLPEAMPAQTRATGSTDRQRLFAALGATLRALASIRRVSLLLEDLHWADPATLDLLEHLLGRGAPVPIVGTWRTGDASATPTGRDWLARVLRGTRSAHLELVPLTSEETTEQLLLLGAVEPDQVLRIQRRSQGQPLFTEQLAAHLDDETTLPTLLADLLDTRLQGLTEGAWTVARTLGLAERPLSIDQLSRASAVATAELTPELRRLQERRLIQGAADGTVQLQHPLLGEAVRRRLVIGEDASTHRSLAEALGADTNAEPAEVAAHWRRAGNAEQEIAWRIAAARRAAARFDRRQEADHWLRALEIWPASPTAVGNPVVTRADAYLGAMDGLRTSFCWDRAAELSDAAEDALTDIDARVRAELLYRAAEYRGQREGPAVGRALIEEALALYADLPVCEGVVRALDWQHGMLTSIGDFAGARESSRASVVAAEQLGDPVLLRDCLMRAASMVALDGDLDEGLSQLERAAGRAGARNDPLGDLRQAVYATDMLLSCGGRTEEIVATGDAALAIAGEHDIDNYQVLLLRFNVACALLNAGRVADAGSTVAAGDDQAVDLDRLPLEAVRGVIEARRGRPEAGHARLETMCRKLAEHIDTDIELLSMCGDVGCWAREPAPSLERLMRGLDVLAGSAPVRRVAPGLLVAARCAADLPSAGSDRHSCVRTLQELADRAGILREEHLADRHLSALASTFVAETARLGHRERASGWADAATRWDGLDRPHDAAYCRWRGAQVALRDGQGTLAARLLRRAATDSREHVPLNRAIAATMAGAR